MMWYGGDVLGSVTSPGDSSRFDSGWSLDVPPVPVRFLSRLSDFFPKTYNRWIGECVNANM